MDLTQLKEKVDSMGFSPEAQAKLDEILNAAITAGSLSEENKKSILAIIDVEIEGAKIEADVLEEMSLALSDFASSVDNAGEGMEEAVDEITEDFSKEVDEINSETPPPTPPQG